MGLLVHSVKGVTYTKLAKRKDVKGMWGEWDRDAYDVEDFAAGFIRFGNGSSLSLSCSFLANMEKMEDFSTTLFGTEAGINWPDGKIVLKNTLSHRLSRLKAEGNAEISALLFSSGEDSTV